MSALVVVEIVLTHRQQARALDEARRLPGRLPRYPSVTVIRPVRGADVGAAENYAAALDNGYPGDIETIFIFDDETDSGFPIAKAAIEAHEARGGHGRATIVV